MNTQTHTETQQHGNKGIFRPSKHSPHFFGQVRSLTEERELERLDREKKECAIVRRSCNGFFDRRGIKLDVNDPAPEWNLDLIEGAFNEPLILRTA